MVKKLINKMDFKALETKMKKCKVGKTISPQLTFALCRNYFIYWTTWILEKGMELSR